MEVKMLSSLRVIAGNVERKTVGLVVKSTLNRGAVTETTASSHEIHVCEFS